MHPNPDLPLAHNPPQGRGYLIAPPPLFPLVPALARTTFRYEVDPGRMWFFEQKQVSPWTLSAKLRVDELGLRVEVYGFRV